MAGRETFLTIIHMEDKNADTIFFSKDFQMATKDSTEEILFLQWIVDIVCLSQALWKKYDRWYQQLFYIKLVGIFEHIKNINLNTNAYSKNVIQCINEIYENISDDEYIYIVYRRHGSAHPLQNKYDLYDSHGNKIDRVKTISIRGVEKQICRDDIVKAINRILSEYNTDQSYDEKIVQKIHPIIQKLNYGLKTQLTKVSIQSGAIYDSQIYKLITN